MSYRNQSCLVIDVGEEGAGIVLEEMNEDLIQVAGPKESEKLKLPIVRVFANRLNQIMSNDNDKCRITIILGVFAN